MNIKIKVVQKAVIEVSLVVSIMLFLSPCDLVVFVANNTPPLA
jgi:hypothetical protein